MAGEKGLIFSFEETEERLRASARGFGWDLGPFELFDATHMAIDYRYPLSLAWLATRLAR